MVDQITIRQPVAVDNDLIRRVEAVVNKRRITLEEAIGEALSRWVSEEAIDISRCRECFGNLTGGGNDWCDCPGGDDPVNHPYQRRASWSGDYWCAVEGCTTKPSAHPS